MHIAISVSEKDGRPEDGKAGKSDMAGSDTTKSNAERRRWLRRNDRKGRNRNWPERLEGIGKCMSVTHIGNQVAISQVGCYRLQAAPFLAGVERVGRDKDKDTELTRKRANRISGGSITAVTVAFIFGSCAVYMNACGAALCVPEIKPLRLPQIIATLSCMVANLYLQV
ncbi:hypothetical protein DFH08DRAFT_808402 [Mycena albidolilacea]|uniref:Uncharacterized protein n=1 Tax=Mycena albidolilacea TaxID=1033008 RepID=A0AAD7ETX4_9AGAR|nr:hypothetical protein DFH08DRAFT_808402 [Mycena albidolilacea]